VSRRKTAPPMDWIEGLPSVAEVAAHAEAHPYKGASGAVWGFWIEKQHPDWRPSPLILVLRVEGGRVIGADGIGLNRELRARAQARYLPITPDGVPVVMEMLCKALRRASVDLGNGLTRRERGAIVRASLAVGDGSLAYGGPPRARAQGHAPPDPVPRRRSTRPTR